MSRMNQARARAFTVIEVMLALALVAMLTAAVMSFLWQLTERQRGLGLAIADSQAADALLDRLEGDLLSAVAGDAKFGSGVEGTGTRLRLLSRGVELSDAGMSDMHESVYVALGGGVTLSRRTLGLGAAAGSAEMHALSTRIARVRFRYFDGSSWQPAFDSAAAGALPAAVEVAVWFSGRGGPVAATGASAEGDADDGEESERGWPPPDRLRVIVVPDGPEAAWSGRGGAG